MTRISCRYCGDPIAVGALDLPLSFREDPATAVRPRQFVVVGGGVLLHCCEVAANVETMADPLFFAGVVHQAIGMVCVQAGVSKDAALNLLMDASVAADVTLEQLAVSVVDRTIRFDPPS